MSKVLNLDTVLSFGRYKGSSVKTVVYEDPEYLLWLEEDTDWHLSDDLRDMAEARLAELPFDWGFDLDDHYPWFDPY